MNNRNTSQSGRSIRIESDLQLAPTVAVLVQFFGNLAEDAPLVRCEPVVSRRPTDPEIEIVHPTADPLTGS